MKIGLGFSYLNAEKEIPRALDPWYPHVDHIIALDGRYKTPLSPDMRLMKLPDYSTDNSKHVLKTRYGDKLTYEKVFDTQMNKRQRCLDIAGELGCDYLIVWDSDDFIHPDYQDWNRFFKQLQVLDLWDDELFQMWAWIPSEELWPKQHNAMPSNYWAKYVRVHKNPGQQRYVWDHFTFAKKDVPLEKINEWDWTHPAEPGLQALQNPYILMPNIALDGIRITTDRTLRTPDQLTFGDGWAWQNMHDENYQNKIIPLAHARGIKVYKEDQDYYFDHKGYRIIVGEEPDKDPLQVQDGKIITS